MSITRKNYRFIHVHICPSQTQDEFQIFKSTLFLIYINDLSNHIKNKCKLFTGGKSFFSAVYCVATLAKHLQKIYGKLVNWLLSGKQNLFYIPLNKLKKKKFSRNKQFPSDLFSILIALAVLLSSTAAHNHLETKLKSKLSYEQQF